PCPIHELKTSEAPVTVPMITLLYFPFASFFGVRSYSSVKASVSKEEVNPSRLARKQRSLCREGLARRARRAVRSRDPPGRSQPRIRSSAVPSPLHNRVRRRREYLRQCA